MRHLSLRSVSAVVLFVACTGGCTRPSATPDAATPPAPRPPAIARVNGEELSREAFDREVDRARERFSRAGRVIPPSLDDRLKADALRRLVDDALLAQHAKREGVVLPAAELDAKLLEYKTRFGSPEGYKSFLERTGQSEADLREELRRNELRDRLVARLGPAAPPDDAEVKSFYEANLERYKEREQARVLQVMWRADRADPPDVRKKAEARARAAAAELKKKGVDFKAKIAAYADAAPSPNDGDLGWVQRGRQLPPLDDAIFAPGARAGEVIGPIETQLGFHVVKVMERKPERQKPLEAVAAEIRSAISAYRKGEQSRGLMQRLNQEAKVEVLEAGLKLEAPDAATAGSEERPPDAATP